MTVLKHFFENYRGGHDLWADMISENTVLYEFEINLKFLFIIYQKIFIVCKKIRTPPEFLFYTLGDKSQLLHGLGHSKQFILYEISFLIKLI